MKDLSSYEVIALTLGIIFIVVFIARMCDTFVEPKERFKRALKSAFGITGTVIMLLIGYALLLFICRLAELSG